MRWRQQDIARRLVALTVALGRLIECRALDRAQALRIINDLEHEAERCAAAETTTEELIEGVEISIGLIEDAPAPMAFELSDRERIRRSRPWFSTTGPPPRLPSSESLREAWRALLATLFLCLGANP